MEDIDRLVEELGAVLAAPDLPRHRRNEPGLDKKWKAGDLAAQIPKAQLEQVADKVGISLNQLRSYAEVARAYPPEERTVKAAWTIYREVRILPSEQRREVLKDGLTLRRARIAIGKGPMDQPRRERQSDEARAWAVIDELQEPHIRALVMQEMESSTADRKARKAARTTLDEIAARRKLIDAELRKQAQEPTPDRKYWQASKELTEAARFVYAVARLHERHRDSMTEERWADIVVTLRNLVDSAGDVADRIEGIGNGEFIEAEAVNDLLQLPAGTADIEEAEVIGD
jgi:hypothetical protein